MNERVSPTIVHLTGLWPDGEALTAAEEVKGLIEHPGWKRLIESRDAKLKQEQVAMMVGNSTAEEDHNKTIGKWAGLSSLEGLAQGIVDYGAKIRERRERRTEEEAA